VVAHWAEMVTVMAKPRRRRRSLVFVFLAAAAGIAAWELRATLWANTERPPNPAAPEGMAAAPPANGAITALGRLRPKDGVTRVAGPARPAAVIARLLVDKGDHVQEGQVIAILDSFETFQARLVGLQAQLDQAQSELRRLDELYHAKVVSVSERDAWRAKVTMFTADLQQAKVELGRASVRAPIGGEVLDVHARAGERVGPNGIAEIARTDQMYAVAEVYETDIGRVHVGQHATITSPVFSEPLQGTVERVGRKVGKLDLVSADPAALTDARVVEVEVRLDDSAHAGVLTNLEVTVAITP
jgi:HlyD family secretion protein